MTHQHPSTIQIRRWSQQLMADNPILQEKILATNLAQTPEQSTRALEEVIKFLYLCSQNSLQLVPSKDVDIAWHEFILFTRAYQRFCEQHIGQFIHHQPSNDEQSNDSGYHRTLTSYQHIFGQPDNRYWPCSENPSSQCGLCEN